MNKKVYWCTEKPETCAYRLKKIYKTSEKSTDDSESQKIYASMECISTEAETPRRKYGDSLYLTNWILDLGVTCHMEQNISDYIPGSLVETYKYIKVLDGNFIIAKQKGHVQIEMCDENEK